eukprot:71180-Pelagomonas_calceolata.AAC.1
MVSKDTRVSSKKTEIHPRNTWLVRPWEGGRAQSFKIQKPLTPDPERTGGHPRQSHEPESMPPKRLNFTTISNVAILALKRLKKWPKVSPAKLCVKMRS